MYWLSLTMLAALNSTFSQNPGESSDGEYRRHLTEEEKQALAKGQVVVKTHWAYDNIRRSSYHTGMLQVQPLPGGKLRFKELGHWQSFYKGKLTYEVDYYSNYRSVGKVYDEAGNVSDLLLMRPMLVKNDTIIEEQTVYLNLYNRADTLAVQHHFYSREYHHLTEPVPYWSYDVAGKHSVPIGWKLKRY